MVAPLVCAAGLTWRQVQMSVRDSLTHDVRVHSAALSDLMMRIEGRASLFGRQLEAESHRGAAAVAGARAVVPVTVLRDLLATISAPTDFIRGGRVTASNTPQPLDLGQPLIAELLARVGRSGERAWGFPYQRDGRWVAPFAQAFDDGLVIVISAELTPMQYQFDAARLPRGLAIGVATADRRLWFRWPMQPEAIGRSFADHPAVRELDGAGPSGIAEIATGLVDARRRVVAWHRIGDSGMHSLVGVPKAAIIAEWAEVYGVALALMAVLTAALGWLLWRLDVRAEQGVREALLNERAFHDYARASGDWHWQTDAEGRVVRVSESIRDSVGLEPERVLGKTQDQFLRFVRDAASSDWQRMRECQQRREPYRDMRFELLTPRGMRWISISGVPVFDDAGVFQGYRDVAHDATERIHAEQRAAQDLVRISDRLRLAVSAAGIGIWEWRIEAKKFWCDAALLRLLGRPDAMNVQSAHEIRSTVHPDDGAALADARALTASGRQNGHEIEYRVVDRDGAVRHLFETAIVERDRDDAITRMVGAVVDVTTRRRLDQAERERAAAEVTNRAKSELVSRVSHEFRTPLNAILGFAQLLQREPQLNGSPKARTYVGAIADAGTHLLALVNDMLDLSQIEANRLTLHLQPVPLDDAVGDAAFLASAQARQKNVTIVVDSVSLSTRVVHADPMRLQQVLLNLLANSVKYNRDQGHVYVGAVSGDRGRIGVRVADTGVGIPADKLDTLFRPFERISSDVRIVEGAGLGLAISRHLVEAMGGEIEVQSTAGSGSTFTVWLNPDALADDAGVDWTPMLGTGQPAVDAPRAPTRWATAAGEERRAGATDDETAPPSRDGAAGSGAPVREAAARAAVPAEGPGAAGRPDARSTAPARAMHVLYVEDNPLNARLVAAVLDEAEGIELTIVDNGREGVALCRSLPFDLVMLDLNLPDIDGLSAMREIRRQERAGMTIIAVSADASPEVIARALEAGFDEFWTKPIDVRRLQQRLRELADALRRTSP